MNVETVNIRVDNTTIPMTVTLEEIDGEKFWGVRFPNGDTWEEALECRPSAADLQDMVFIVLEEGSEEAIMALLGHPVEYAEPWEIGDIGMYGGS